MSRALKIRGGLILLTICISVCYRGSFFQTESKGVESEIILGPVKRNEERKGRIISRSAFMEEYGEPERSTMEDLEAVYLLLNDCQLMFKDLDAYFLPDNQAITAFLTGGNPEKIIWIPKTHFAVNAAGELVDRFGTPLFFHRVSGLKFEVQSAGEDQQMWTEDDFVFPVPVKEGSSK